MKILLTGAEFDGAVLDIGKFLSKMDQKGFNVLDALTKRRGAHWQDIESVIQVFPETPFIDFLFQVSVGGRNHPHINGNLAGRTNRIDGSFLQDTQQLHLHVHGHVANFIEKEGAAMGQLKATQAVRHGARERAFSVTKEFALQEFFRDGAAIDRHEVRSRSDRLIVQGAGQQLFTRPAFSGDQNRGVGVGDGGEQAS